MEEVERIGVRLVGHRRGQIDALDWETTRCRNARLRTFRKWP